MSDDDRDYGIGNDRKRRAEHYDMRKKRREDMDEEFREMQRALPRYLFKGLTKVSHKTILEKAIEFAIFKQENGQRLKAKRIRLEAECKQLEELSYKISEKLSKGEKAEAKMLYEQHIHLFESDSSEDDSSDDDSSGFSSDDEENVPNDEYFQIENTEEEASDSYEETDEEASDSYEETDEEASDSYEETDEEASDSYEETND